MLHRFLDRALRAALVGGLSAACGLAMAAPDATTPVREFARAETVDLSSSTDGRWSSLGTLDVWELDLRSPGAVSLSLHLESVRLPLGAVLAVTVPTSGDVHGEYTPLDISPSSQLWTAMVPGDALRLRLVTPAGTRERVNVEIAELYHGLRELRSKAQSGACQVSTACPSAANWADTARSVAMITIGGTRQCSATLLNNTRSDGDPLLLTARHCFVTGTEELSAESVVTYWSYAVDSCGSGTLRVRVSQSGAALLAHNRATDATLLRLTSKPPASANARYSGWDAGSLITSTGVSIHHPRGDDRKISTHLDVPRRVRALIDDFNVDSLLVNWSEGTTEPGSSGSGLFNANGLLIGQLSGGSSACDISNGPDFYGRLDLAFSSSFQPFLDPDDTGAGSIEGIDASALSVAAGDPSTLDPTTQNTPTTGLTLFGIDIGSALSDATGVDNPADESEVDDTEPQRQEAEPGPAPVGGGAAPTGETAGALPVGLLAALGFAAAWRRRAR